MTDWGIVILGIVTLGIVGIYIWLDPAGKNDEESDQNPSDLLKK
tara:strand:- start:154 stop:285 length:132 start_codon:yes stop_codon:yes gene_type:complete